MAEKKERKKKKSLLRNKKELNDITLYNDSGIAIRTYTKDMLEVITNTVAKGASPEEVYMFLTTANRYGLDPFAKEIWFIPMGIGDKRRVRIETSRDGYLKIANSDPDFAGVQSAVVHENDEFTYEFGPDGEMINFSHKASGFKRGAIVGAWAVARHKIKGSFYSIVPIDEYDKGENAWNTNPSAMIMKVAEAFALKRIASISGLVTAEEMGTDVSKYTEPKGHNKSEMRKKMEEYSNQEKESYECNADNMPKQTYDDEAIDAEYEVKQSTKEEVQEPVEVDTEQA